MAVVLYRTAALLRKRWRATLALALVGGLASGLVLGLWAAGRRSVDAYDRFVAHVDEPPLDLQFCAPGVTAQQFADNAGRCPGTYDAHTEEEFVAGLPEVSSVAATSFFAAAFEVGRQRFDASLGATVGAGLVAWPGNPIVTSGRLPTGPREMAVNEVAASAAGAHVGQTITIRPLDLTTSQPLDLPPQRLVVTGTVRYPLDLAAALHDVHQVDGVAFVSPAWWARWGPSTQSWGTMLQIRLHRGHDPAEVRAAVARHWPGRFVQTVGTFTASADSVSDAIGYEASALVGLGVALAFAAVIFVGQALAREVRREQADLPALRSLGLSRGQAALTALARAAPVAAGAGVIGVGVAWVSSAWTPIGLGRRAEIAKGMRADLSVAVLGGLATVALVLVCMTVPAVRARTRRSRRMVRGTRVAGAAGLSPAGVAGVGMVTVRRRAGLSLGAAMIGLTMSVAVIAGAAVVVVSLHDLVHHPARYGAPWDATVSKDQDDPTAMLAALRRNQQVEEAGVIYEQDARIADTDVSAFAVRSLKGADDASWQTITEGRAPERDDEAALGARTMHDLRVGIGDSIALELPNLPSARRLTIVGRAVFNDGSSADAGAGVLVRPPLFGSDDTGELVDGVAVRLRPGATLDGALGPLEQTGASWFAPTPPASVRNLQRIHWLPWALAAAVALLAAAALAHALLLSARANRGDLAVLRSLGFTRRQVRSATSWEAATLALGALVVGVPLGLLLGMAGWRALDRRIGLDAPAAVPPMVLVYVPAGVIVIALVLSVWPGRRAAELSPALALRTE